MMKNTMNLWRNFLVILLISFFFSSGSCQNIKPQTYSVQIPHLGKQGTATRLIVNGKPFLMIAGELHNSTCKDIYDYCQL